MQVKFHHGKQSALMKLFFYMFSGCNLSPLWGDLHLVWYYFTNVELTLFIIALF